MKKQYRVLLTSCLIPSFPITVVFCISLLYLIGRPTSYVWVMDGGLYKNETYLVKMCPTGERLLQIQFGQSGEIGIDPAKDIIWAPEGGDRDQIHYDQVIQIDQDGEILNRFQGYSSPILALDANDGSVWVSTWNSMGQHSLMTKIASNGKLIRRVRGFYLPSAVALDPRDGSIWVADGGNRNITHLSREGEKLFEMPVSSYFFSNAPDQIAVDPENGNVWFTTAAGTIHKMSADGEMLIETGGLSSPVAVAINPVNGNVWVADYDLGDSGALVKLDPQGNIILVQALPGHAHTAAINPFDGALWVGVDGEMIRYDDDGGVADRESGFTEPESIAFADRGNDLRAEIKCTYHFYADMLSK